MTDRQYDNAEADLIGRVQAMHEAECGARSLVPKETSSNEVMDDHDDVYDAPPSSEYQAAIEEFYNYCRIVKNKPKYPRKYKKEGLITIGTIQLGMVEQPGDDLDANYPFVKCNLAEFIDENAYFDLIKFLDRNKKTFPYLYKLGCCLASLKTNEVGCERFFSQAGYVSNPRRTRLNVKNYGAMAMLKRNMQHVYIDEDWVVQQYLSLEKSKGWDAGETSQDNLVIALERELYAEEVGVNVASLPAIEPVEKEAERQVPNNNDDSDTDPE